MNVFIKVFFEAFSTILLAIVINTAFVGSVFPVFDNINAVTGLGGGSFDYTAMSNLFKYTFLFALNICVIIPYLYLFNWLTKKEPKTETEPTYYYYAG